MYVHTYVGVLYVLVLCNYATTVLNICIHTYVCTRCFVLAALHVYHMYIHMYTYIRTYMHTYLHMCTHMYICLLTTCMYVYVPITVNTVCTQPFMCSSCAVRPCDVSAPQDYDPEDGQTGRSDCGGE